MAIVMEWGVSEFDRELVILLIGVASGVVVAAFGGALTLISSAFIQDRQHRHERELNRDRAQADALLEFRRLRLVPILDFVTSLEAQVAYRRWEAAFAAMREDGLPEGVLPGVPREMITEEVWFKLKEQTGSRFPHRHRDEIAGQATTLLSRVEDLELRAELFALAYEVTADECDFDSIDGRLERVHAGLDAQISRLPT